MPILHGVFTLGAGDLFQLDVIESDRHPALADDPLEANAIVRVRSGDVNQYDFLVGRYMKRAYSISWGIVRNAADAEEIVQESFVRAFEKLSSFRPGERFGPWFFRIVTNLSLDVARRRTRFTHESIESDSTLTTRGNPYVDASVAEIGARIDKALTELPQMQSLVARLYLVEQFSHGEIAAITGLSEGTARSHLSLARRKLKTSLADLYEGVSDE